MVGIYAIQNLKNGKLYIGQSVDIHRRWRQEKQCKRINQHLKRSFIKYGINNFIFYILELCSRENLNDREKFYIKLYRTLDPDFGYNETSGGDSSFIRPHQKLSEEHKEKISKANKGRKLSKETIIKQQEIKRKNLLKKHKIEIFCLETGIIYKSIEEIVEKLNLDKGQVFKCLRKKCESTRGYHICFSYEKDTRKWNLHPYKNNGGTKHWHSDTKEKISQKAKGRIKSKEECKKISDSPKGRKLSDEHKRKISKGGKGKIISEVGRKNISLGKKVAFRKKATTMILCIETNEKFFSTADAAEKLRQKFPKVNRDGIKRVLSGKQSSSGGLHFKRVDIKEL